MTFAKHEALRRLRHDLLEEIDNEAFKLHLPEVDNDELMDVAGLILTTQAEYYLEMRLGDDG